MTILRPGDVLYIYCRYIDPPHYKYVVCTCPNSPLFFFINSEPRRRTPDAQVLISKSDFPFLHHDSYIDTARMCTFYQDEITQAQKKMPLTQSLMQEIASVVTKHNHLPPRHIQIILNNFASGVTNR